MSLKKHKPTSAGRRHSSVLTYDEITTSQPEKSLLQIKKSNAGRNSAGRVTIRHRGGGHKRKYRMVDFKRDKVGVPAKVATIEYDPNRTANIALLNYADGEKRYILAPLGLEVGQDIMSGPDAEPKVGNALPLGKIPAGAFVHNIELEPGRGGQIARSAGTGAQLMSAEGKFAQLKLRSGEIRLINMKCMATVGQVGNPDSSSVSLGKAGRKRWMGIRPTVRGVAMNPVDHPMGGGEGRSSGGGHPVSPWGKLSKAGKSRKKRRASDRFIVKRRRK